MDAHRKREDGKILHLPVDDILESQDTWRVDHVRSDCAASNHCTICIVIVTHQIRDKIAHVRFLAPDSAETTIQWHGSIAYYFLQFVLER